MIGYGSPLRGDDRAGPRVAAVVARWPSHRVRAIAAHQLTPELAATLATADLAIFIDADPRARAVRLCPLSPRTSRATAHTSDPRAILALTATLYDRTPAAWLLSIPAADLTLGAPLSPTARSGCRHALRHLRHILRCALRASRLS
ncbi:MAG: hydrogenase maturation protease [Chloroflexi bacterium OHK40]